MDSVDFEVLSNYEPKISCIECEFVGCLSALIAHWCNEHLELLRPELMANVACEQCPRKFVTRQMFRGHKCDDSGHMEMDTITKVLSLIIGTQ